MYYLCIGITLQSVNKFSKISKFLEEKMKKILLFYTK